MKLEELLQPALLLAVLVGELYVIYDIYRKDKKDELYSGFPRTKSSCHKKDYLDKIRRNGL